MYATKERKLRVSGEDENGLSVKESSLGTLSPDPGIYRVDANPSESKFVAGVSLY